MVTYFEILTVELHVLYVLNTYKILCQIDFIYYLIYKLIFYTSFCVGANTIIMETTQKRN